MLMRGAQVKTRQQFAIVIFTVSQTGESLARNVSFRVRASQNKRPRLHPGQTQYFLKRVVVLASFSRGTLTAL